MSDISTFIWVLQGLRIALCLFNCTSSVVSSVSTTQYNTILVKRHFDDGRLCDSRPKTGSCQNE